MSIFLCFLPPLWADWVCLSAETMAFHTQFGRSLMNWFFSFFAQRCAATKKTVQVNSGCLFLNFFNTSDFYSTQRFERTLRTCDLLHRSLRLSCLRMLQPVIRIVFRPQHVMRKELQWSVVSVVSSSLRSASLQLKQNYTVCQEDLSFDTVTRRHQGTFAIVMPQYLRYCYIPMCFSS